MTEPEIILAMETIKRDMSDALALVKHWRNLHALQMGEITRLQNEIDVLITERIEREFVCGELKKRVAELNEVIETMWQDVKSELPEGMNRGKGR